MAPETTGFYLVYVIQFRAQSQNVVNKYRNSLDNVRVGRFYPMGPVLMIGRGVLPSSGGRANHDRVTPHCLRHHWSVLKHTDMNWFWCWKNETTTHRKIMIFHQEKKEEENELVTVVSSSWRTWSYSDMATQKMMAVTSSKQWIHFFRSERWPPTSNNLFHPEEHREKKNQRKNHAVNVTWSGETVQSIFQREPLCILNASAALQLGARFGAGNCSCRPEMALAPGRGGGGWISSLFDSSEYWYVGHSMCTYAPIKFGCKNSCIINLMKTL